MIFTRIVICVILCFVSICYAGKPFYFDALQLANLFKILFDMNAMGRTALEQEDHDALSENLLEKLLEDTKYFTNFLLEPEDVQHEITRDFAKKYLSESDNLIKWNQRQLLFSESVKGYYDYKLDDEVINLIDYMYDIFKPLSQQGKKIHYDREFDPSGKKLLQLIVGKDLSNSSEEEEINPHVHPHLYYEGYP